MNKLFSEIGIGQEFKVSGSETTYRKIELVRVSCCKSFNAEESNNNGNKTFFQPGTAVVVNV
jgi:hypothetical protein